jgi:hypothetical protein
MFVGPIVLASIESLGLGKIKQPERILFGIDTGALR